MSASHMSFSFSSLCSVIWAGSPFWLPYLNYTMFSFSFMRTLAPLITVERSPTGILKGKSRDASIIARKIHQPAMDVTNNEAPAPYLIVSMSKWLGQ